MAASHFFEGLATRIIRNIPHSYTTAYCSEQTVCQCIYIALWNIHYFIDIVFQDKDSQSTALIKRKSARDGFGMVARRFAWHSNVFSKRLRTKRPLPKFLSL